MLFRSEVGTSLGALVERLVRDVPRVRYRLTSIEATEVDDHLGELLTGAPGRVAPHLHAPLQSGSDRLLKIMDVRSARIASANSCDTSSDRTS